MALESSSASSPSGTMNLQKTFEEAILCFIFGPPEQEEMALKKFRDIIDFVLKYKFLREYDSDDQ